MKLYKKDSKGRIRTLEIWSELGDVMQESGLIDGKKVKHIKKCSPKNVGKKNETTSWEQAMNETESLITKKLKEGYFKTEKEAEETQIMLPMLAKSTDKQGHKIIFPCYAQPKLDGMRCLANEEGKISRKNTKIDTLSHIKLDGIKEFIDGEVYAHGKTFQENMKLIKKYVKGETENIKYHVYDMVSPKPFIERYRALQKLVEGIDHIKVVETTEIANMDELNEYHCQNLENGYEGTMVRWGDEGYAINSRSDSLLKHKDFKDLALPIIDVVESSRVPGQGIVVIEYNGHLSKTGSRLSHAERAQLLIDKDNFIGKTAEIRYFEETDKGALRFPIFHGVRLDK